MISIRPSRKPIESGEVGKTCDRSKPRTMTNIQPRIIAIQKAYFLFFHASGIVMKLASNRAPRKALKPQNTAGPR